jgi:aspartyl protease family protein
MTGDQTASLVFLIVALGMVASSMFARRIPLSQLLRMILSWVVIFAALIVIVSYREQIKAGWAHIRSQMLSGGNRIDENGKLRINLSDDGHFWAEARINGKGQRLMVDTGATQTAIGSEAAKKLGIDVDRNRFPVLVETANGTVKAWRAKIDRIDLGPISRRDFSVLVSDSFGDTQLLGMDFLSSLKGWRVERNELILN